MVQHAGFASQADLDAEVKHLREINYPYIGQPEDHRLRLLPDGRIASEWSFVSEGEVHWETDESPYTQEEWAESVFCWANDC